MKSFFELLSGSKKDIYLLTFLIQPQGDLLKKRYCTNFYPLGITRDINSNLSLAQFQMFSSYSYLNHRRCGLHTITKTKSGDCAFYLKRC